MKPQAAAFDRSAFYRLDDYPRQKPRDEIITGLLARGEMVALSGFSGQRQDGVGLPHGEVRRKR